MNRRTHWNRGAKARGFTLIEVMIVIAIVLALSAIVGVAVLGRRDQADLSLTQTKLNNIKTALKFFKVDFGRYPSEEEGLAVLWDKEVLDPEADVNKYSSDGYLEEPTPSDQWGNEWGFRFPSQREDETQYDLWSFGPNGEDEDGEGDDITSWRKDSEEGGLDDGLMAPPPSGG
jgi:general secretion pathway protein G